MHGRAVCTPQAASSRRVECRRQTVCVVRYSNSGHQLLLPPANWCPIFALPDHAGVEFFYSPVREPNATARSY